MFVKNFKELTVWKLGNEISLDVYKASKIFPREELFGLVSQIRRAAISIPSNIAEGFNRNSRKEFARFLYIALGSCAELETQLELSHSLKYLDQEFKNTIVNKIVEESRMLKALAEKSLLGTRH